MRKISANYIFPCARKKPVKNGIVILSSVGEILEFIDPGEHYKELANVEFYNGILIPGLVFTKSQFTQFNNSVEISITEITAYNYPNLYQQGVKVSEIVPSPEMMNIDSVSIVKATSNQSALNFGDIICALTFENAVHLKVDNKYGSFSSHRTPGVNLISPFDFDNFCLNNNSKLKRLL